MSVITFVDCLTGASSSSDAVGSSTVRLCDREIFPGLIRTFPHN